MVSECNIDMRQFKGFAFVNTTGKDMPIEVTNESAPHIEGILRNNEVYYCKVADIVNILSDDCIWKFGLKYLSEQKEKYLVVKIFVRTKREVSGGRKTW